MKNTMAQKASEDKMSHKRRTSFIFNNISDLNKRSYLPSFLLVNLFIICLWFGHAHAQTTRYWRLGFMEYSFTNVPLEDAKIAIEIFATKALENTKFPSQTGQNESIALQIRVLQTREDIKQALNNNEIDMISLSTIDYLLLSDDKLLVPSTISANEDNKIYNSYILLVPKTKNWTSLSDLQHAHIRIPTREKLIPIWIDVALAEARLPKSTTFFGTIKIDERATQSILAVFFNQADACIVDLQTFQTLSQLNPQISRTLTPIVTSPEFISELMCFHANFSLADRKAFEKSSIELTDSQGGKQILSLFKAKRILRFEPEYIQSLLALFEKYETYYGTKPDNK
jgi:ABC-type phosphate/phosphonate transport system substrate-binding protein